MGHYYRRMTLFDTLRASQQLQEAGFEAPQADALVTVFAEDLGDRVATKDDVLSVREELTNTEERLRGEMRELEHRLVNRIYLAVGAGATFLAAVMGVCTAVIVAFG